MPCNPNLEQINANCPIPRALVKKSANRSYAFTYGDTISLLVIYHKLRGNLLLYAFMLMEYWMCDNMDGRLIIIK